MNLLGEFGLRQRLLFAKRLDAGSKVIATLYLGAFLCESFDGFSPSSFFVPSHRLCCRREQDPAAIFLPAVWAAPFIDNFVRTHDIRDFSQPICLLCLLLLIIFVWLSDETPLHRSARGGHLGICRLLLQCNADPQAKKRK